MNAPISNETLEAATTDLVMPRNRVLIADDRDEERAQLKDVFVEHGFEVFTVTSGREAYEMLMSEPTLAVAVIDEAMPRSFGTDFLRQLAYAEPDLPVVVLSDDPVAGTHAQWKRVPRRPLVPSRVVQAAEDFLSDTHYDDRVRAALGAALREATHSLGDVEKMRPLPQFLRTSRETLGKVTSSIEFGGGIVGRISLSAGPIWWERLTRATLGAHAENSRAMCDCAGEVCNMMAQAIRNHYYGRGIESQQTPPIVFTGERVRVLSSDATLALVAPFYHEDIPTQLFAELMLSEREEDGEPIQVVSSDDDMLMF